MKIWKGAEMEGPEKGIMTLFVKDELLSGATVLEMLKESPECERLYLGAGRTDVKNLWPSNEKEAYDDYKNLLDYCKATKIKIVMECSLTGTLKTPSVVWESCDQIIIRVKHPGLKDVSDTDLIKLDYLDNVRIIEIDKMIHTSLENLENDMFTNADVILYSDEEDTENECDSSTD